MSDAAIEAIVADWRQWAEHQPRIIGALHGGLSNSSVLLQIGEQRCVLRLNGIDSEALGIDRDQEAAAQACAGEYALAPALLYRDTKLRFQVSEYVPGRSWTEADLSDRSQLSKLAGLLAAIHSLPAIDGQLDITAKITRYKRMQRYHSAALLELEHAIDIVVDNVVDNNVCTREQQHSLCHGDLLAANIVEKEGRLWALDWEYAAMSSPYFDLAVVIEGQFIDPTLQSDFIDKYNELRPQSPIAWDILYQWRIVYGYLDCLWYALWAGDAAARQQVEQKVARLDAMLSARAGVEACRSM